MVWIMNNSTLNPKKTTIPALDHYTNGSTIILTAPYGDVEYEVIGGVWVPVKALTDINITVSTQSGTDIPTNGSIANPLRSVQYATTLIPKQIKNLTITILDTSDDESHTGLCVLKNLIKTNESDIITIRGTHDITFGETPCAVTNVTTAFGGRIKVLHTDITLPTNIVHSGGIVEIGVDPNTGYQYITQTGVDFKAQGVMGGMVICNANTDTYSVVVDTNYSAGIGYMYIADNIFANTTQVFGVFSTHQSLRWIMNAATVDDTKIGKCFPVMSNTEHMVYILDTGEIPADITTGDGFYGVSFPIVTLLFENITHNVFLNKLSSYPWGVEPVVDTQFINCKNSIISREVEFLTPVLKFTPEFIFNRSIVLQGAVINHCTSIKPKSHNSGIDIEIDAIYNATDTENNYDTGVVIIGSIVSIESFNLYKSSMTIRGSILDGLITAYTQAGAIIVVDSYIRIDTDNMIFNVKNSEDGDVSVFYTINNGMVDSRLVTPYDHIFTLAVDTLIVNNTTASCYYFSGSVMYSSLTELLSADVVPNGATGLVLDEPGNAYIRFGNKWVPRPGNQYTTEVFDTLFAATNVIVPNGLEIFNTTIGREVTWIEPDQVV